MLALEISNRVDKIFAKQRVARKIVTKSQILVFIAWLETGTLGSIAGLVHNLPPPSPPPPGPYPNLSIELEEQKGTLKDSIKKSLLV